MKLIYCRGGDKLAVKVCERAGLLYGTRHDYTPYLPVYMLDIHFAAFEGVAVGSAKFDALWQGYLDKVTEHQPVLAMTLDYFAHIPKALMLEQAAQVRAAGAKEVMVCPKFHGAVADIPADCIVAISVPTPEYAGFLPQSAELTGRRLHLLGGYPDQYLYLQRYRYPDAIFESADGNILAKKAYRYGMWWSARYANWIQAPKNQYRSITLMIQSAIRIVEYLENPSSSIVFGPRIRRVQARMAI